MRKRRLVSALCAVMTIVAQQAFPCPTCYGDANSTEVQGMQWAIVALLGVTGTVLVGVGSFFFYLRKKAQEFNRRFSDRLN